MIAQVVAACVDGASILELCVNGDKAIEEGTKTVYTKGKLSKGMYATWSFQCFRERAPMALC